MTPFACLIYGLAVAVILGVVTRLAHLPCAEGRASRKLVWHLWVTGQIAIAVGALAVLVGWASASLPLIFGGLVATHSVRYGRRSSDA